MKYLIIYDADCRVCNHSITFITKRDTKKVFDFLSMNDVKAKELIHTYQVKDFDKGTLLLIKNKHIYTRAEAVLEIITERSFPWPILGVFKIIPLPLLDAMYKTVAKNRHRIFSKKSDCRIDRY